MESSDASTWSYTPEEPVEQRQGHREMHGDNRNYRALRGLAVEGRSLRSWENYFQVEVCGSVDLEMGDYPTCQTDDDIHCWQNNLWRARSCCCRHCCIELGDELTEGRGKNCYC